MPLAADPLANMEPGNALAQSGHLAHVLVADDHISQNRKRPIDISREVPYTVLARKTKQANIVCYRRTIVMQLMDALVKPAAGPGLELRQVPVPDAKAPSRSTPTPLVSLHHWMLPVWQFRQRPQGRILSLSEKRNKRMLFVIGGRL